jgi:hypothetical protein
MSDNEFVWMEKDGQKIQVHPLVLEGHLKLGWTLVEIKKAYIDEHSVMEPVMDAMPAKKTGRK